MLNRASGPNKRANLGTFSTETEKSKAAHFWTVKLFWLPLVDRFRTVNWTGIKSDLQFSGILGMFPSLTLQN